MSYEQVEEQHISSGNTIIHFRYPIRGSCIYASIRDPDTERRSFPLSTAFPYRHNKLEAFDHTSVSATPLTHTFVWKKHAVPPVHTLQIPSRWVLLQARSVVTHRGVQSSITEHSNAGSTYGPYKPIRSSSYIISSPSSSRSAVPEGPAIELLTSLSSWK